MVSVPCYRCNRYHRIVSLDNMLSHHKGIVLKSSRPSFKEGSTSHLGLLPSGKKRKTVLRCSEPLRSKVGGPSKPSPYFAGWDRMGKVAEKVISLICCYSPIISIVLYPMSWCIRKKKYE